MNRRPEDVPMKAPACDLCGRERSDVRLTRLKTGAVRDACMPCADEFAPKPKGGWVETEYARWSKEEGEEGKRRLVTPLMREVLGWERYG